MSKTPDSKLLPCPFCGGEAANDDLLHSVYCTKCVAETPDYLWNRRSPAPDLAAFRERCARVCEKRAEARFEEHGYTEPDTNSSYYIGAWKDLGDSLDEEDADCAAAIRALPLDDGEGVKTTYTILDAAISLLDAHDCKAAVRSIEAAKKYIPNVPVVNS